MNRNCILETLCSLYNQVNTKSSVIAKTKLSTATSTRYPSIRYYNIFPFPCDYIRKRQQNKKLFKRQKYPNNIPLEDDKKHFKQNHQLHACYNAMALRTDDH